MALESRGCHAATSAHQLCPEPSLIRFPLLYISLLTALNKHTEFHTCELWMLKPSM